MFFKRKNINPELQEKVLNAESNQQIHDIGEEQEEPFPLENTATPIKLSDSTSSVEGENRASKKQRELEEREKAVDEAKKQLALELDVKHYYHQRLLETLDLGLLASLDKDKAKSELHDAIVQLMTEDQTKTIGAEGRKRVIQQIEDEVFGLGPLEPLLNDATVSDILVNGPKSVFVERRGKLERTPYTFLDDRHLRNIIDRIVSQVGRRIDEAPQWWMLAWQMARGLTPLFPL